MEDQKRKDLLKELDRRLMHEIMGWAAEHDGVPTQIMAGVMTTVLFNLLLTTIKSAGDSGMTLAANYDMLEVLRQAIGTVHDDALH